MAVMKGCFAMAAVVVCLWRLGRPVSAWRGAVYGLAPAAMFGGAVALWRAAMLGPMSLALHLAILALLAAALTDPNFIPWPRARKHRGAA
jgi:hypothetical protein